MAEDSTFNFSLSNISESDLKITTPPIMIKSVDPIVPNIARRAGISGIVGVKAWVYTDSLVKRASIVHSEADLFNEAALRAVMQYKFIPARSGDKFTSGWIDVFVRFNK